VQDTYRTKGLRKALVKTILNKGITDTRVLEAIGTVPRHYFFEGAFLEHAYEDKAFPIGEGQTISQPYTVAYQSELLQVEPGQKVLEIGTGSGYQCCVLLEMGARVYSIEYSEVLHERTAAFLPRMGYRAVLIQGDGSNGLPSQAPFDRILVTAGAPSIPFPLIAQLKDGGKLVIPVGDESRQKMVRITKVNDKQLEKEEFSLFSFVPLVGSHGWKK
jgi:protein-L-isoaspartate(D-aspartate) O-methyltransferase